MRKQLLYLVSANGAKVPKKNREVLILDYLPNSSPQLVHIGLPAFVTNLFHIPGRILDLLELACFVFAADRCITRGPTSAVEFQSWSRKIEFHIRVRDFKFWNQTEIKQVLKQVLQFMTGDSDYFFHFYPGHTTPPTNLFDKKECCVDPGAKEIAVTLFSGGLDSLSGALNLLANTNSKILLVSHLSQAGTKRTQKRLADALSVLYPNRIYHYRFECTLRGKRAVEETQRSRSFLYSCIAYAIASAYKQKYMYIYENGVTSINLQRREDLYNARASRTTHPKTIGLLENFFSIFSGEDFKIKLPYFFKTKKDILENIISLAPNLISSAVSCSRTFQKLGQATHCGYCFQCIDRRIASFSAKANEIDHNGLYSNNIIIDPIFEKEAQTTAIDYIRQAISFEEESIDHFESEYTSELADVLDYVKDINLNSDADKINSIWKLFRSHGKNVKFGLDQMRIMHDDVFRSLSPQSLLHIISKREYLKAPIIRLVESISEIVNKSIPEMFAGISPKDEPDLNEKIGALIRTHEKKLKSEHPTVSFACANVIPDHQLNDNDLLIEAKYIRDSTTPSKVTDGIASDITKYPSSSFILFIVYDPAHKIKSDETFCSDIESKGSNRILILR